MESFRETVSFDKIKQDFGDKKLWGLLTSLDLYDCDLDKIQSYDAIQEYVIKLCDLINVRRYGDPQIVKFGRDPKVTGYSLVQLIETSLVSGHFADNSSAAYLDIFSCAPYDTDIVVNFSKEFFGAQNHSLNISYRA